MSTIIIDASPRSGGNSAFAAAELYEKYKDLDGEIISLRNLSLKSCQACRSCKVQNSLCALKDDMALIYEKLLKAEKLIFISPNHFGFLSSLGKIFTDRWYCLKTAEGASKFSSGKKAVFIFVQGSPSRSHGENTAGWAKKFFENYGFKYFSIIIPSCSNDNLEGVKMKMDEIKMSVSIF